MNIIRNFRWYLYILYNLLFIFQVFSTKFSTIFPHFA